MSTSVKTRLVQYGAVDNSYTFNHLPKFITGEKNMLHDVADYDFDYMVYHLSVVQNPTPRAGASSSYYVTEDPETWSDSPTINPTLDDNLRYSYGRGDGRLGKLDDYVGVVIHNSDFSDSGDYIVQNHTYSNYVSMSHLDNSLSVQHLMQNHSTPTGDVTVKQYDLILLASPEPFSYRNPVDSNVSIRLGNYINPLNSGTLTLYLGGEIKEDVSIDPFYAGLGGFDATWVNDREFEYNSQVDVEWHVFDVDSPANEFVIKYWFRTVPDVVGPRVSSLVPADNSTGTSVDTCIQFIIRDYECGVNIDTLELYVNNQEAVDSGLTISELPSLDGYSIRYCPTESFLYGDEVPVSIYVEDMADQPNYLFYTYSFTTELSSAPKIVGMDPVPCRKYKSITENVEVDLVDGGHGLNDGSIMFSVDDKVVINPRKLPIIYRED